MSRENKKEVTSRKVTSGSALLPNDLKHFYYTVSFVLNQEGSVDYGR